MPELPEVETVRRHLAPRVEGRSLSRVDVSDERWCRPLAAPDTINTIPDKTLLAFADHGSTGNLMPADGGDAEEVIAKFVEAGIDDGQLAADLQREGAESFVKAWQDLLDCIASKGATLKAAG